MRQIAILFLILIVQPVLSQKKDPFSSGYSEAKLVKVLSDIEQRFKIRYSYADSIVASKKITLPQADYTLERINAEIELQTSLTIIQISKRYYSVFKASEETKEEHLQEILVEGFLTKGISKSTEKVIISPQQVEALPGVTDADILLSLQQLPGVKSPNETASGLHIRGGTSDQNLILWDGIRMYHSGHLFGMISGFNPNVQQTVHYYNKATNPKFGERISSVIDIRPTDKIEDKLKINAGINALNADVYIQTPLIKNKLGLQIAARKSFTEWMQSPTFNTLAKKVFQNTNFKDFNNDSRFEFEDYSAKLNFVLNPNTDFSFTGILIDNYLDYNNPSGITQSKSQKMDIRNHGYSFHWNQKYGSKWNQHVLIHYSFYVFDYEKRQQNTDNFELFRKLNRITDSGLELNYDFKATENLILEYGYQLSGNDISHSFSNKTRDLELDLDKKQLFNMTHSGYIQFKYLWKQCNFQIGARYNEFIKIRDKSFEPRLLLQRSFTGNFIGQLSYERKTQITSQVRESVTNDLSLENYIWILSDKGGYPVQRANQYTSGLIYKTKSWLIDVDAYYKTISAITSLAFGSLQKNNSTIRNGNGFTKGLDILIRKSAPTWRVWMTYTYQDSQNKFDEINGGRYFTINSDSRHAFNLSLNKKWNNYSVALGWFWHSGKPYSILDKSGNVVAFNTERLPSYHRLDISVIYQFAQRQSWSGKVGCSFYNVYNQHTIISKEYERQYASLQDLLNPRYAMQDYYSLGMTPNIFLRFNF